MSEPNTLNTEYKYTSDYQPTQPTYHPFQGNTQNTQYEYSQSQSQSGKE